jgi:hypothetical protein
MRRPINLLIEERVTRLPVADRPGQAFGDGVRETTVSVRDPDAACNLVELQAFCLGYPGRKTRLQGVCIRRFCQSEN